MNPAPLEALIQGAEESHSSALVLVQGGHLLIEEYFDGPERNIEAMSVTKAIVNLVVGRAVTMGALPGVDFMVADLFPEWKQGRKQHITLRMLMNHTSGLQAQPHTAEIYASPDYVQLALCAELSHEPGTHFFYNNKAANLISGVIERAIGETLYGFARRELMEPLGIRDFVWHPDPAGHTQCMAGLQIRPTDLARLGGLLLTRGEHEGQALISPDWFDLSLHPTTETFRGIGLLWWLRPQARRFEIRPEHVERLRMAGASPEDSQKLASLIGVYERPDDFYKAATVALGSGWGRFWPDVPWVDEQMIGPTVAYSHSGHLGQYLMVIPESRLVAVRMIAWDHPQAQQPESGFATFPEQVMALSRS